MGQKKAKPKPSLLEVLKVEKNLTRGVWEDALAIDVRRQLDEVKAAINSGALKCSKRAAHRRAREILGLNVSMASFQNYLNR